MRKAASKVDLSVLTIKLSGFERIADISLACSKRILRSRFFRKTGDLNCSSLDSFVPQDRISELCIPYRMLAAFDIDLGALCDAWKQVGA